ncbi:putative acyltransferase [Frankia casuarinae]|uniref:acyltransferase family protein n=1 Tax=Frankia casuarinae (strain DSM 45818 / CECT 9043 / HFP020203 / CcI3) TaxID=106370 RepID=UPI0002F3E40B|nr:acyltransferase [Frankia casuarinae]EYT94188.1 putative acyltransferase [Frankia casuarinae]
MGAAPAAAAAGAAAAGAAAAGAAAASAAAASAAAERAADRAGPDLGPAAGRGVGITGESGGNRRGRRRTTVGDPRLELVDLGGFRGVAAISVIIFHAYQFCRGDGNTPYAGTFLGQVLGAFDGMISWFFLVSGFLLYMPMANRVRAGRTQRSPKNTLIRRGLRILPLYYTALIVVWAARNPTLPGDWIDLVEHLTFTQVFDSKRVFYTIGPAWSLAVEVYFYLYLALVAGWLRRQTHRLPEAHRWRRLCLPPVLLIVVSAVWIVYAVYIVRAQHDQWAYWFSPQNYAGNFGLGMITAVLYVRWGRERPLPALLACALRFVAAGLIIAGALVRGHTAASFEAFSTLNSIGFGVLFAASVLAPRDTLWRRFFATPAFVWLGMISYSVYLWHEPILLLVLDRHGLVSHAPSAFPWVAAMLVTVGVLGGWISYVVLEKPGRRLSILVEKLRRTPVSASVSPALVSPAPVSPAPVSTPVRPARPVP